LNKTIGCSAALLLFFGLATNSWSQCNQNCAKSRTIAVNAVGNATADADLAIIHVGYKLYGSDAKSAYSTASDTSNAIMQALTGAEIPKSAIESGSQALQHTPQYELQQMYMGSEDRFHRQFTVTQSWTIRVKPDNASKALNTAINAGANESGWIEWVVDNPSVLQAQASGKAFQNARMIAEQIVQKSDAHLGRLVSVTENQSPPRFMNGPVVGGVFAGAGTTQGMDMTQPLAIHSRRVEYDVSIYAVFAIE
jgi:uncharacterized protein